MVTVALQVEDVPWYSLAEVVPSFATWKFIPLLSVPKMGWSVLLSRVMLLASQNVMKL